MQSFLEIPQQLRKELRDIEASTDAKGLARELESCFAITVLNLIKAAALIRRLEELGVELSVESAILPYLRLIAYGQLLPELFMALQVKLTFLRRAARLPIPDQRKIAENRPLKVMELGGDFRMIPPQDLTAQQISQVFDRDRMRTEAEQISYLRDRSAVRGRATEQPEVALDRKNNGIVVGTKFISASDLAHYLSQLTVGRR